MSNALQIRVCPRLLFSGSFVRCRPGFRHAIAWAWMYVRPHTHHQPHVYVYTYYRLCTCECTRVAPGNARYLQYLQNTPGTNRMLSLHCSIVVTLSDRKVNGLMLMNGNYRHQVSRLLRFSYESLLAFLFPLTRRISFSFTSFTLLFFSRMNWF